MSLPVKLSDIKMEPINPDLTAFSKKQLLPDEIPGASVFHYTLPAGKQLAFPGQSTCIRIFFLCDGSAAFSAAGQHFLYRERAFFVAKPEDSVEISVQEPSSLLEICWTLSDRDLAALHDGNTVFPISQAYADAPTYQDSFKSETTISRSILKQSVIPRFAMGSVEAQGDTLVGQHAHPQLDQLFFSFPENDMDLLIDCRICPMKGNTLLHIPLGSNHGVIARGQQHIHYLWIDCAPSSSD